MRGGVFDDWTMCLLTIPFCAALLIAMAIDAVIRAVREVAHHALEVARD